MKKIKLFTTLIVLTVVSSLYFISCKKDANSRSDTSSDKRTEIYGEPLAPTNCTTSSATGAKCAINCNDPKTADCQGGSFRAICQCLPLVPPIVNSTISLDPNHKFSDAITLALGFGTPEGDEFADALQDNYIAVSAGNYNDYMSTVDIVEIKFNLLSTTEQNDILTLLN